MHGNNCQLAHTMYFCTDNVIDYKFKSFFLVFDKNEFFFLPIHCLFLLSFIVIAMIAYCFVINKCFVSLKNDSKFKNKKFNLFLSY